MSLPVNLLVPNFNGGRFLRQTLTALLRQTHTNFTVILVDNRSTDDSLAIAQEFSDSRLRIVAAQEHVPIFANFNRALRLADSPLLALCASDEMYESDWLAAMADLMERHPDAFFACCKADSADTNGHIFIADQERYKATFWPGREPCVFDRARQVRALQRGNHLVISAGIFRASAVRQIGYFNERYSFVGDWEYWFRGLLAGYRVVGTHRPLVHYRRHALMTTKKLNADLRRFQEELDLIEWIAQTVYDHKVLPSPQPKYALVRNTLMSEFAVRLSAKDYVGAEQLLAFGRERIPGFRGSFFDWLMRTTQTAGRSGGRLLQGCEWGYLRILSSMR